MKRRTFVKNSGLAFTAGFLPIPMFSIKQKKQYKMGLQAFTIRDAMAKDLLGSLKTVKSLGYEDLELYGFDSGKIAYYGHTATDFKAILDDFGLSSSSCHYGFSDYLNAPKDTLRKFVDTCIKGAHALKHSYITWPWMAPEQRTLETFERLPDLLNTIGEQVNQAGLGFAYHNHDFEFHTYGENTGFDMILKGTDPSLVKIQLDLYWAVHSASKTPKELIATAPERFVMWHIKDMDKITRDYTELGNGSIDYSEMIPALDTSALEFYYLEQGGNFAENSIQSITDSADFFKRNLKQLF
ncbi:sugar phosphate isomerase/epimerase family protein [Maribacter chungangensis]|uniref:Sugar phosphate isomerase/epimerase family protein n=1 Tax=Maribacter chungangensis TaxID=1069117 RepID=A0ABW3B2G1_9FLAO